ncbi:unnamed protein product [Protopolystoma xenopodis]|uniref:Uncharacterized protein n=1 Tax=Protopolystoma xenopodis TaxID=117903 RepID=A0A448WDC0_9PLAT|nr:unnamed protein product [Protopolystoma xenopodis]
MDQLRKQGRTDSPRVDSRPGLFGTDSIVSRGLSSRPSELGRGHNWRGLSHRNEFDESPIDLASWRQNEQVTDTPVYTTGSPVDETQAQLDGHGRQRQIGPKSDHCLFALILPVAHLPRRHYHSPSLHQDSNALYYLHNRTHPLLRLNAFARSCRLDSTLEVSVRGVANSRVAMPLGVWDNDKATSHQSMPKRLFPMRDLSTIRRVSSTLRNLSAYYSADPQTLFLSKANFQP